MAEHSETEILQKSMAQSAILEAQLQQLMSTFRPLLDNADFAEQMAETESYLYDIQDALADFHQDCEASLAAWQEAHA